MHSDSHATLPASPRKFIGPMLHKLRKQEISGRITAMQLMKALNCSVAQAKQLRALLRLLGMVDETGSPDFDVSKDFAKYVRDKAIEAYGATLNGKVVVKALWDDWNSDSRKSLRKLMENKVIDRKKEKGTSEEKMSIDQETSNRLGVFSALREWVVENHTQEPPEPHPALSDNVEPSIADQLSIDPSNHKGLDAVLQSIVNRFQIKVPPTVHFDLIETSAHSQFLRFRLSWSK